MKVSSTEANGVILVTVQGEVDLYSSPDLRHEIVHWADGGRRSLVVDLGGVTYMDSSGIATLVEGFRLATKQSGQFRIARPNRSIQEVLRFAHLDQIFPIFETVEEALDRP
jgi:anti-sigma B factor antagonist